MTIDHVIVFNRAILNITLRGYNRVWYNTVPASISIINILTRGITGSRIRKVNLFMQERKQWSIGFQSPTCTVGWCTLNISKETH